MKELKKTNNMKPKLSEITTVLKLLLVVLVFSFSTEAFSQTSNKEQTKLQKKEIRQSKELMSNASLELQDENFPVAEADYRKAISLNPGSEIPKYNLGNAYYNKSKSSEAMLRYKQAASVGTSKAEKHKAFHNLGNVFMNQKKYQDAVEAYKNALRNNPTDDETRYNLALAKEMLEKNPPQGDGGDDDNKDKNEDNKDNKDKQNQDDKSDEGDKGDEKEENDKGDKQDDKKEGDDKEDKGKPDEPKDKDQGKGDKPQQQQQQPVPGQLSPQQVKSLLEAMNNEEKKVQDKMNAEKQKGAKIKSEKDW
tara:strand:- start:163 stop:1083 length:921 start_codon:yes stop_codon:yes gene_type:complete